MTYNIPMVPTKADIIKLLDKANTVPKNHSWVQHSYGVGDSAGRIAQALNQKGQHLDAEKVVKLGYLHDIGKTFDPWDLHPLKGYNYLHDLGYDEEYCQICMSHSFVNNDPFCMFSDFMKPDRDKEVIEFIQNHEFTTEERLVALCDMMCGTEMWTLDKRIVDIISRHGTGPKTAERILETYRLKRHIDDLLDYNLYDLFPEIKDNL